jgi:hypothetical protein
MPRMRNLKKLCRPNKKDDCEYLEYELEPQRKAENYDAPARHKFRWIKKNK